MQLESPLPQAALNYLPWAAWKAMEGGRVTRLLAKVSRELITETPVEEQVTLLLATPATPSSWVSPSTPSFTPRNMNSCSCLCYHSTDNKDDLT